MDDKVLDLVIFMAQKRFKADEIKRVLQIFAETPTKARRRWRKHTGRWLNELAKTHPNEKTADRIEKIYEELKDKKQLGAKDVAYLLGISAKNAIRLMHLTANLKPHVKEFREKHKLYLVWTE